MCLDRFVGLLFKSLFCISFILYFSVLFCCLFVCLLDLTFLVYHSKHDEITILIYHTLIRNALYCLIYTFRHNDNVRTDERGYNNRHIKIKPTTSMRE